MKTGQIAKAVKESIKFNADSRWVIYLPNSNYKQSKMVTAHHRNLPRNTDRTDYMQILYGNPHLYVR